MAGFNKVILVGNLTRDPELRYTPSGVAIAKISLAVNRNWKSESGEMKEEVTFVDVDAFRRQAEVIGQYLKKGKPVLIEGRLKLDQWEDKQSGQKRSRLGVVLENFQFLEPATSRSDSSHDSSAGPGASPSHHPSPRTSQPTMSSDEPEGLADDDDVPF